MSSVGIYRCGIRSRMRLIGLAVVLAAIAPRGSDAKTMEERMQAVCRLDIQRVCPETKSDEIKACMLAKRNQVSTNCMRLIDASE